MADFIGILPTRFDNSKIVIANTCSFMFNNSQFIDLLTAKRPNMTLLAYQFNSNCSTKLVDHNFKAPKA